MEPYESHDEPRPGQQHGRASGPDHDDQRAGGERGAARETSGESAEGPAPSGEHIPPELIAELRAVRPQPTAEFRNELDRRAAEGFPRRSPGNPGRLRQAFGSLPLPTLRPAPAFGGLATACALAVAVVIVAPQLDGGGDGIGGQPGAPGTTPPSERAGGIEDSGNAGGPAASSAERLEPGAGPAADAAGARERAGSPEGLNRFGPAHDAAATFDPAMGGAGGRFAPGAERRRVDRDASLVLAPEPSEVQEVASGVLEVADSHEAVVLSSSVNETSSGEARGRFSLMVPAARLDEALADLSALAGVRERRESTLDITAPTVSAIDRLRTAQADVRGLLGRLSEAASDEEREEIQQELDRAQSRVASLRAELNRLQRRARYAAVDVTIVAGENRVFPEEDEWTIGDAVRDALDVLTVAAGIALVTAAVLLPVALVALLVLAIRGPWLRRRRERALRAEPGA